MSNQAWWLIPLTPPHKRLRQEDRSLRVQCHSGLWMEEEYKGRSEGGAQGPEEATWGRPRFLERQALPGVLVS